MACFLVPLSFGLVLFFVRKKFPAWLHVDWFLAMVFGGSFVLGVEHFVNGEIVPFFPFLSALKSAEETNVMLNEMLFVGFPMFFVVLIVWLFLVFVYKYFLAKSSCFSLRFFGYIPLMFLGAFLMFFVDYLLA
ncbi:MAG: hypothetical protein QXU92_03720 [Candidatus Diapherotrites archaeon]